MYFCEIYLTCVSSKLCEFIPFQYSERVVLPLLSLLASLLYVALALAFYFELL